MSNDLEIAAAASAGGFVSSVRPGHVPAPGTACANCATPLQGPWCHSCGQSAEDFHRSIVKLAAEVVEGLLHADGRLWRTLPDLMFRPGRLTRAYLEGHRAPQIPPLRLFLVVLLALFVVGGLTSGGKFGKVTSTTTTEANGKVVTTAAATHSFSELTPAEKAAVQARLGQVHVTIGGSKPNVAASNWLEERLRKTLDDPERFHLILEQWSERFAFLMLPVSALLLSLLFVFQRRFFLFDHTIFSLHSLSAMGVVITLGLLLTPVVDDWAFLLLLPAPVHLFVHMRGVYRTSVAGALVRMALLFLGSSVAASLLVVGLLAVGLNGMVG